MKKLTDAQCTMGSLNTAIFPALPQAGNDLPPTFVASTDIPGGSDARHRVPNAICAKTSGAGLQPHTMQGMGECTMQSVAGHH